MISQRKPIALLNDFSGGYVSSSSPFISSKFLIQANNVCSIHRLSIQRRLGRTIRIATDYGQGRGGIYHNFYTNGERLVYALGADIYAHEPSSSTLSRIHDGGYSASWQLEPFGIKLLLINKAEKKLYEWDGDLSTSISAISGAPSGYLLKTAFSYAFMAGFDDYPSSIRYSDAGDHTSWPSENIWPIASNDGDIIKALSYMGYRLYILKQYSIHRLAYLGSYPLFDVKQVADVGTKSPDTVKVVFFKDRYYIIFLSTDKKVYMFDGYNPPIEISTLVSHKSFLEGPALEDIDDNSLEDCFSVYFKKYRWYVLFYKTTNALRFTRAFVFDLSKDEISVYPFDNQTLTTAIEYKNDVIVVDYDGNIYNWFSGNTDNGEAIKAWLETPFVFPNMQTLATIKHIGFLFYKSYGSIKLGYKGDYNEQFIHNSNDIKLVGEGGRLGQTYKLGEPIGESFLSSRIIDVPVTVNNLRIRVESEDTNDPFVLFLIELYGDIKGFGGSYGVYRAAY